MNKKLEIIQEENSDCGICSLASIIKYYGGYVSLEMLRFHTGTDNNGTNAYEIIKCAKLFGFNAYGEKNKNINNIKLPVIAHLKLANGFYHFVAVYKIKKDFVTIMDPSRGICKILIDEFNKVFTGIVIKLIPINTIPKYKKNNFLQRKFLEEIKTNKKNYIRLIIFGILLLLFSVLSNFEIKLLSYNSKIIYILILLIFFNELLIYKKNIILLNNSIKFNNNIINNFVNHIFKLPLYYLKLKQKGEISTRFNELNDLSNNIMNISVEFLFCIILAFFTIIIIVIYSFQIFLLMLIITLIYIFINCKIYKKLVKDIRYMINQEENYNCNILEYISNFETIKHLNIYKYFTDNISINLTERNNISKRLNKKIYLITTVNNILFELLLLIVLYYILKYSFDLSNGLVIYILMNFYVTNLKNCMGYYPTILLFKTFINKSNDFLSVSEDDKINYIKNYNNILISNLNYKINGKEIIYNLNYKIKKCDKIFIKGPSGIGKSTLMKILNNEINRYDGNVLIDNKDIRNYNLSNLITYVSQDETLFNDTIHNNLTLGLEIDKEEINRVIKLCRLNNINIIKSYGLNALIINNNILSGGEKNRLILARSLIHSKNILILDEVLKEVDLKLENEIIKDLLNYYTDKTILYISHKNIENYFDKVLTFRKE